MSKTFSVTEIEKQIFEFEGVKIRIHDQLRQARFTTSYAEWAQHKMCDEASISELQLKVDTFIKTTVMEPEDDPILSIPELREIDLLFRSGNSVEVQRSWVSRADWVALKDALRVRAVK